jgi:uncharacterized protein YcbK (DUF882 family)
VTVDWNKYSPILTPDEFRCKCGCGELRIDADLVGRLFEARRMAGIPFVITSGYRCLGHNATVTTSRNSAHPHGLAADIRAVDMTERYKILTALLAVGFRRIGIAQTFLHADVCRVRPQGIFLYG